MTGSFYAGGREVTRVDYLTLTSKLGFGDDGFQSPAAHPSDLIDPLEQALYDGRIHQDCPEWCDDCDQWEMPRSCEPCWGSGCGPGTASGAYEECEHCAGDGRLHEPYTPTGTWRHKEHEPYRAIDGPPVDATLRTHPSTMIGRAG